MYLAIVTLTMLVLPVASIGIEHLIQPDLSLVALVGRWFVFWGVGVRLGLAGLRQVMQPGFTAREIFHLDGDGALPIVRELGIANLSSAIVGLASIIAPTFVVPTAVYAATFYGIAGVRHVMERDRSGNETIAMVSDLFLALILAGFLVAIASRAT